jgi:transposase-like protein
LLVDRVLVDRWSLTQAAVAAGVSDRTARKWVARWREEGESGLLDRPTTPKSSPSRTSEDRVQAIVALRGLRMTGAEIAECLGMALSTVSGILTRIGMGKLGRLGLEPAVRYERSRPGELLHIDVKKLGRIQVPGHRITGNRRQRAHRLHPTHRGPTIGTAGWEFVHVCIDDAARLAYVEVLDDEKGITAVGFLRRALAFYAAHGITVEQLLTDNGSAYRSTVHAIACHALGIKHIRTRPYRPQTNGKAERFIRTLIAGWAYGALYRNSNERTAALPGWLERYNWRRPHGALNHKPPGTRLHELNKLLGSYS